MLPFTPMIKLMDKAVAYTSGSQDDPVAVMLCLCDWGHIISDSPIDHLIIGGGE